MDSKKASAKSSMVKGGPTEEEPQSQTAQLPDMKIDTSIFRDHIKQKYKSMISAIDPGNTDSKVLIIDSALYDVLRHLLTKEEIGVAKIYSLKEDIKVDSKYVVFLTPPSVQNVNKMSSVIKNNIDKSFYVCFVPRRTFACKEALQQNNIFSSISNFYDFNFDLIPLDYDILSLEIPDASRQLYLDLDTTTLVLVAESIQRLQLVFGRIDTVIGKGYSSKIIVDMLKNLENESKIKPDESVRGEIDCCVILDRNVDFVTPMLTQFTYSGYMDEVWGIKQNNVIMLEKKFFPIMSVQRPDRDQDIITHKLQNDKIFKEIKDCHNFVVGSVLDEKLTELKSIHDEVAATGGKEKSLKEMREKYEKERKLREKELDKVATHVEIRKYIDELMAKPSHYRRIKTEQCIVDGLAKPQDTLDFVETQIAKQAPLARTLRLLCLQSLVESGIKQVPLDAMKREIIQAYGFEHILTLSNLEKAGLLRRDGEKKIWDTLNKQLKLINPEINDLKEPNDASFAYDGYCPILVRLVEQLFKKDGWNAIKNSLEALGGLTVYDEKKGNQFTNIQNRNVILVYLIGGVTYGEIAAFRYLAKKYNKEILIATTGIITGDRLIGSFFEKFNK
jgi:hypothetical protein